MSQDLHPPPKCAQQAAFWKWKFRRPPSIETDLGDGVPAPWRCGDVIDGSTWGCFFFALPWVGWELPAKIAIRSRDLHNHL